MPTKTLAHDYIEHNSDYLDYLSKIAETKMDQLPYDIPNDDPEYQDYLALETTLKEGKLDPEEYEKLSEEFKTHSGSEYGQYLKQLHNSTLARMLCDITPIHLLDIMQDDLGDDLHEYKEDPNAIVQTGDIVFYKIAKMPKKYFAVAIIKALMTFLEENGWGIGKESGDATTTNIYIYSKKYWDKTDPETFKRFLELAAIKMEFHFRMELHSKDFLTMLYKQAFSQINIYKARQDDKTVLINLQNGTFEVSEHGMRMREHRKDDFVKHVLSFEYNTNAQAPMFKAYLDKVLPNTDSQMALQEFHGYIFTRHLKLEKALILYGNGSNGKSVQFEITKELLGKDNVSTKSFGALVDSDSGNDNRVALKDKLLNYGSEIGSKKINVDVFKRLVSGEPVSARAKYHNTIDLDGFCKFIFNANKLPETKEHTDAFYRRFLVLPYLEKISDEEKDPELPRKIIANELPGVFNWAIEGLQRLLKEKKFTHCQASDDVIAEYKVLSNPVAMFVEEYGLIADETQSEIMFNDKLSELYETWRKKNKEKSLTTRQLSIELYSLGFSRIRGTGGKRGFNIMRKKDT